MGRPTAHLSVTAQNHHELASALERVFTLHADKLRLPDIHVVYTVPPWLGFDEPEAADPAEPADDGSEAAAVA